MKKKEPDKKKFQTSLDEKPWLRRHKEENEEQRIKLRTTRCKRNHTDQQAKVLLKGWEMYEQTEIWQKSSLASIAKEVKEITKAFSTIHKYNKVKVLSLSIWQ